VLRTVKGVNAHQEHAFSNLLAAWRRREDARAVSIHQLAEARAELDRARDEMWSSMPVR
jgi:hypothetical protein